MYPTFDDIKQLHKKYTPSEEVFNKVFTHCQIVLEIAQQVLQQKEQPVNNDLVVAGALLHDIGAYKYLALKKEQGEVHYYRHAFEGAEILRNEGLSENICSLVEHHLGLGLSKKEIIERNLELPHKDFLPLSIEERLVMYADKFHSKTPKFNSFESYKDYAQKFGDDRISRFEKLAEEFGKPELAELAEKYHHPLI